MREILRDVMKQINGLGFIDTLKVTGTATETKIEGIDENKTLIVKALLNTPQPDLIGTFGVSGLPLLNGLLNFVNYKVDDATFSIKHRSDNTPEEFEFRDVNGLGANFRLMSDKLVPEQPLVADIKWDVSFEPVKSKISEFSSLAGLYSQFDQFFSVKTQDGNLVFCIGEEDSTNHNASMVFAENIVGEIKIGMLWPVAQFLGILKMAEGHQYTLNITVKGAMQISVTTDHAQYSYILPARRR